MTSISQDLVDEAIRRVSMASRLSFESLEVLANRRHRVTARVSSEGRALALKIGFRDSDPKNSFPTSDRVVAREAEILQMIPRLREGFYVDSGAVEDLSASFLILKWLDGAPFLNQVRALQARGEPIVELLDAVARGLFAELAALHGQGWIHGDLQPNHIYMKNGGSISLIDYGAAQGHSTAVDLPYLGALVHFNSPEVCREVLDAGRATATVQSELFSAASVLYFAATGSVYPMYPGKPRDLEWEQLLESIASGHFNGIEVARDSMSDRLFSVVKQCLAFEPSDRPVSAQSAGHLLS